MADQPSSIHKEVTDIINTMLRDGVITMHTDHQAVDQILEPEIQTSGRKPIAPRER